MTKEDSNSRTTSGAKVRVNMCTHGSDRWTALNIAGVVAGFIVLGPLGLAVLFWVLSGRDVVEIPAALQRLWHWFKSKQGSADWTMGLTGSRASDNRVFNDYQQTQLDRIQEIRDDMNRRRAQFEAFREQARRRKDEEEFRQFMNESPLAGDS